MVWIAAAGLASYGAAVVVVRRALGRRWQGVRFVVLDPRAWSGAEWVAAALAIGSSGAVIGGVLAALTGHPGPRLAGGWPLAAVGAVLLGAGIALMVWAQLSMGASWRIGVDHRTETALVVTGPFRLLRNPIYTAMTLLAVGVAAVVPTAVL